MKNFPHLSADPSPHDMARMATEARRGNWVDVDDWVFGTYRALTEHEGGPSDAPRELVEQLGELYDTGHAVDLARHGTPDELADWLAAVYSEGRDTTPDLQATIEGRLERIWAAVGHATGASAGHPDWAARAAAAPVLDRLEIRHRLITLDARPGSRYWYEITPTVLTMRGQLGRTRILRRRVTQVRWLVFGGGLGSALNRFVFDHANGDRFEHWDVAGTAGTKVRRWLTRHGYDVRSLNGDQALYDPGADAQRREM